MLDAGSGWFQPLAFDSAGGKHPGIAPSDCTSNVERDQPFGIADATVAGDFGAGARRQQQARRAGLASPGDAVGVAGQEGAAQRGFADLLASILVWPLAGETDELFGCLPQGYRLLRPRVEGRQDVAGRRGAR